MKFYFQHLQSSQFLALNQQATAASEIVQIFKVSTFYEIENFRFWRCRFDIKFSIPTENSNTPRSVFWFENCVYFSRLLPLPSSPIIARDINISTTRRWQCCAVTLELIAYWKSISNEIAQNFFHVIISYIFHFSSLSLSLHCQPLLSVVDCVPHSSPHRRLYANNPLLYMEIFIFSRLAEKRGEKFARRKRFSFFYLSPLDICGRVFVPSTYVACIA